MQNVSVALILMVLFTVLAYVRLASLVYKSSVSGVKPNIASWLPWLVVDGSVCFASIALGAITASILFGIFTLGAAVIIALVVKNGEIKLSTMDKVSLVLSAIAFVAWKLTSEPRMALYLNVFIAVMATIPTLRQALIDPRLEDGRVWLLFMAGGGASLFAIERWTMVDAFPAVVVFVLQIALAYASNREEKWFRLER